MMVSTLNKNFNLNFKYELTGLWVTTWCQTICAGFYTYADRCLNYNATTDTLYKQYELLQGILMLYFSEFNVTVHQKYVLKPKFYPTRITVMHLFITY